MNMLYLFIVIVVIAIVATIVYLTRSRKEYFVKGYDYLIDGCIKKCELDLLRKNPFFVQLQEGGRFTQNYCRQICASEYNKGTPNRCRLRKIPYHICPLQKCRYHCCI